MSTKRYRARVWNSTTKKKEHLGYYDSKEERDLVEAQARLELSQSKIPKVIEDRARGGELFVTFAERTLLDRKRRVTLDTWKNYNGMLQKWVLPTFGHKKLRDITPRDVDRWFNEVLPVGSPSNGQRYSILSLVMYRAVRMQEIASNPCVVERVSASKTRKRRAWSWGDFYALHDAAATAQERALLWVLAGSGCRIGEALALNVEDIDVKNCEITVSNHMVGRERVEGTKAHEDQVRYLTIPRKAMDAIQVHLEGAGRMSDEPVFTHSRGGRMLYDTARKMFASIRSSRGLDAFLIHDLRHLSLTAFGETGASLAEIMARGGHSDMRSALGYQHARRERDRVLVEVMEKAIS